MNIQLIRATKADGRQLWEMQVEAFGALYQKYQDTETSPAAEPMDRVLERLLQPTTYYYFIEQDGEYVGALRVVDLKDGVTAKRISPIFVMEKYRNQGIAQAAIAKAEEIHGSHHWELDTILEEKGNCHLYEKLGYVKTGETAKVNDRLTVVFYEKA